MYTGKRKSYSSKRSSGNTKKYFRNKSGNRTLPSKMSRSTYTNVRTGGFMGKELKWFDHRIFHVLYDHNDFFNADSVGFMKCLNGVPVGNGPSNRIGRSVTTRSLYIDYSVHISSLHSYGLDVKVQLIRDCQTNNAAAKYTEIYIPSGFTTAMGGTEYVPSANDMRNLEYTQRYKVLKTKTHHFEPAPITTLPEGNPAVQTIQQPQRVQSGSIGFRLTENVNFTGNGENNTNGYDIIADNSYYVLVTVSIPVHPLRATANEPPSDPFPVAELPKLGKQLVFAGTARYRYTG